MYRRPACPVNDKREAYRFHTRRNRGNRVEEVSSFTTGGRWTEERACFIENLSGHNKLVRVDNRSLFRRWHVVASVVRTTSGKLRVAFAQDLPALAQPTCSTEDDTRSRRERT